MKKVTKSSQNTEDLETKELLKHAEKYYSPPPPKDGKIIGIDCHPDTFTAAVGSGSTVYDLKHLNTKGDISLEKLITWASENFSHKDLFLMEAGSNSFEVYRRLTDQGLRACVLESAHIGKHAKTYADNDKIASLRIISVYLGTKTPAVWVPDRITLERRELLHLYQRSVTAHVQSTNAIKGYLNQYGIRLQKRQPHLETTVEWVKKQRDWSELQHTLLDDHFQQIQQHQQRRKMLQGIITKEVLKEPKMLALMSLIGIGQINAFALIAIIGDIRRFTNPKKLAAYLGLNPGIKQSGKGKHIKIGAGKRGRRDMRSLLIQGAQAILRMCRTSPIGKWGWKLFARKGNRNIAVVAVARKLSAQIWHLLMGNRPEALESSKSRDIKYNKLLASISKVKRIEMGLKGTLKEELSELNKKLELYKTHCSTWGCHPKPDQAEAA